MCEGILTHIINYVEGHVFKYVDTHVFKYFGGAYKII